VRRGRDRNRGIAKLFAGPGSRDYLGEPATIGEHMRQAGGR
jgi:predicted HD phosphohydrolase